MESSRLPLQTWLLAIYMMTTARKGISSVQFAKELGVTQKTAWFLSNRIREACTDGHVPLIGEVEIDETYIGGKEKNKHASKKHPGRGPAGKQPVMGMLERGGQVKARPIPSAHKAVLHHNIYMDIDRGSTIYTDEYKSYQGLKGYHHEIVKHSAGEYVKGQASTNGIESFWALLKRGYIGTHHWWSIKHLHRYISEYSYRQNTRHLSGESVIANIISRGVGKRLSYSRLNC